MAAYLSYQTAEEGGELPCSAWRRTRQLATMTAVAMGMVSACSGDDRSVGDDAHPSGCGWSALIWPRCGAASAGAGQGCFGACCRHRRGTRLLRLRAVYAGRGTRQRPARIELGTSALPRAFIAVFRGLVVEDNGAVAAGWTTTFRFRLYATARLRVWPTWSLTGEPQDSAGAFFRFSAARRTFTAWLAEPRPLGRAVLPEKGMRARRLPQVGRGSGRGTERCGGKARGTGWPR